MTTSVLGHSEGQVRCVVTGRRERDLVCALSRALQGVNVELHSLPVRQRLRSWVRTKFGRAA